MKVAVLLIVAVVASGSIFASDAVGTGSLVAVGMAQDGMVGVLAAKAKIDTPVCLDISQEFAEEAMAAYMTGSDMAEYGAAKVELTDEELKALAGSAEMVKAAAADFAPVAIEMIGMTEEDAVIKAIGDAYVKSFDNIVSGDITKADVIAVAGVVGMFSEFDKLSFKTADGDNISFVDYINYMVAGSVPGIVEEDDAAMAITLNIMNTVFYFDMVFGVYGLDFSVADLFANIEY